MKLFYSKTSPFVRKVLASAITRNLDAQIELVPVNPHASPPELIAHNPLSKIPCLVTDDGYALFDSTVICEYLDEISEFLPLFPPPGSARWRALKLQALGDGILDAAVLRRWERQRPSEPARAAVIARQGEVIARALDLLEADLPANHLDIGTITIACALGYLDFRTPEEDWRARRPKLAGWMAHISEYEGLKRTVPSD